MQLFLIDAIGPFFRGYERKKINWSKIPFDHLRTDEPARTAQFTAIRQDMQEFTQRVAAIGYNAVSLDDLAHLADHPWYEPAIRARIAVFRAEFQRLFEIIQTQGLALYITTDVFSYTAALKQRLGNSTHKITAFLCELIDQFFTGFPAVAGLILRIGESDGLDVSGQQDFKSELHLKTPKQVNQFLRALLPVFEKHQRRLILRTWTVGSYRVGDLIWHRGTFARALAGINSPALVLSMKYGESDFFRYLPLNRNFFRTDIPKLIELQARREYEGCGEYPSFVGWDYEHYAQELRQAPNMLGISVWCQTGGWVPFRRLAYIGEGSLWTEYNAYVSIRIFRAGLAVEKALKELFDRHIQSSPAAKLDNRHFEDYLQFFRLSDEAVKELLYIPEFAQQKLFFRRVRIPPLIGVYWNTIFINHSIRKVMRFFVQDPEACVRTGYGALSKIKQMQALAEQLRLPVDDVIYMKRTFKILALARQYFFYPYDEAIRKRLKKTSKKYKKAYPPGTRYRYAIKLSFKPFHIRRVFLGWAFALLLRRQRGYRLIDHFFTIHLLSLLYRLVRTTRSKWIPKFARKSAMGIDTVFR